MRDFECVGLILKLTSSAVTTIDFIYCTRKTTEALEGQKHLNEFMMLMDSQQQRVLK